MAAFLSGVLFGALFIAAIFVLVVTRARLPKREPVEWDEEFFETDPAPPAVTKIMISKRQYTL